MCGVQGSSRIHSSGLHRDLNTIEPIERLIDCDPYLGIRIFDASVYFEFYNFSNVKFKFWLVSW